MSSNFIKINNSKKSAIKTGNWSDPGAKLYDNLLDAFDSRWNVNGRNVFPDDEISKTWNYWSDFLKEAYLIAPVKDIKNSPYGRTPFSRSGCKYPHHIIRNGELLISIPGLKAAYNRACQEGIMKGEVKDHLERHIKELGIEASFHNGKLSWNESALYNEEDEKYFDEKSHGSLKYEYRIGVDVKTGRLTAIQFKLDPSKILAVGNQTSYDTAYILNDIKANPEKDEKLRKIYDKIDELRSQGRNKEADNIEKKLDDIFIKKTADARNNALDFMKKNIKKLGHIDYVSDESIVDKIFYKDGGSIQSVEIVPTLSNQLYDFLAYLEDNYNVDDFLIRSPYSYNRGPDNWTYSYEMLFGNNDVRNEFIKYCKDNHIKGEKYEVGKSAGKNKYRSTKLLWDNMWMYKKYTKSPVIRGQLNPYKITKNFDTYNGLNKPKREKFAEVNERIEANFNDIYRCILENTGINLFDNISEFEESYLIEHNENALEGDAGLTMTSRIFDETGKTPSSICNWIIQNIEYDKISDNEWKLKSPGELYYHTKGNCHDQSLFSASLLHSLGFITGQLFFIEYKENSNVGGMTHTLTWYIDKEINKGKYYWIETAWDKCKGIHGPFDNIEALKANVYQKWKHQFNSNGFDDIQFSTDSNFGYGMSLNEYVQSWHFKDYDIRLTSSEDIHSDYFLNWILALDEWSDTTKKTFPFDRYENGHKENVIFGYYDGNKLNGIIRMVEHDDYYELNALYVNEKVHNKGIGSKLIRTILKYYGHKDIEVDVFADNSRVIHLYDKFGFYKKFEVTIDENNVDPGCEDLIGRTWYGMIRSSNKDIIKESFDWIEKFVNDESFRESTNIFTSGDFDHYKLTDEEFNAIINRDLLDEYVETSEGIFNIAEDNLDYILEEGEAFKEPPSLEPEDSKKQSMPKQTDAAEADKNGVRRKKLYIAFIEWCKEYNSKNTFGSIFDKDAFKISYPFVPNEMRYFYRLANPMLCVLSGDLTFFPVAELRKLNSKNSKLTDMMIFAATPNDMRVFNNKDKKVYRGTDENGALTLHEILGDTFDTYIQKMINRGDILNAPIEESVIYDDIC